MPQEYKILAVNYGQCPPTITGAGRIDNILVSVVIESRPGYMKAYQGVVFSEEDTNTKKEKEVLQRVASYGQKIPGEIAVLLFPKLEKEKFEF